jgi:hypothetical protein
VDLREKKAELREEWLNSKMADDKFKKIYGGLLLTFAILISRKRTTTSVMLGLMLLILIMGIGRSENIIDAVGLTKYPNAIRYFANFLFYALPLTGIAILTRRFNRIRKWIISETNVADEEEAKLVETTEALIKACKKLDHDLEKGKIMNINK